MRKNNRFWGVLSFFKQALIKGTVSNAKIRAFEAVPFCMRIIFLFSDSLQRSQSIGRPKRKEA